MGEIEKVLEKLNEILANAGFTKVASNILFNDDDGWRMLGSIEFRFDKDGKYIEPDNGRYRPKVWNHDESKSPSMGVIPESLCRE